MIEKQSNIYNSILSKVMMIASIIVVLIVVPLIFMNGKLFENFLKSSNVKISPNLNDGYLISEFTDPSGDLLRQMPDDTIYKAASNSLDIVKFSVKLVKFNPFSGLGIDSRMNLCFEFNGQQPNPFGSSKKFCLPVMHVYIKTPEKTCTAINSDKIAKVIFDDSGWNYQVIIDGMHEQARIFGTDGSLIGEGLGLYLSYDYEDTNDIKGNKKIRTTKITAGLPLNIVGDPSYGDWKFYAIVGLLDVRKPSMLFPPENEMSSDIYDCVLPDNIKQLNINNDGRYILPPFKVTGKRSF
jgi:hypothetical protein